MPCNPNQTFFFVPCSTLLQHGCRDSSSRPHLNLLMDVEGAILFWTRLSWGHHANRLVFYWLIDRDLERCISFLYTVCMMQQRYSLHYRFIPLLVTNDFDRTTIVVSLKTQEANPREDPSTGLPPLKTY